MSVINPNPFTTRPEIEGTFGVVASTHWIATAVGMATLEKGGNAFDAAVATAFTLQVVEPHLNGPGGDVPVIVYDVRRGKPEVICGQGPAPARRHHRALSPRGTRSRARHRAPRRVRARHLRDLDAAAARLRHAVAARRAGARDRLRAERSSAGRARQRHHRRGRGTFSRVLADIGRGLFAEQRGAADRDAVRQSSAGGDLSAHPQRSRKRRRRSRSPRSNARANPGRRVSSREAIDRFCRTQDVMDTSGERIAAC